MGEQAERLCDEGVSLCRSAALRRYEELSSARPMGFEVRSKKLATPGGFWYFCPRKSTLQ